MANLQWQPPRNFQVNETEVASYMNAIRDALTFLGNPPVCNAVQASPQSIPTGSSWTSLALDSTAVDTYGGHSNTTNNSRYVSQAPGYYSVSGAAAISSNATGWRGARVAKSGAAIQGGASELSPNAAGVTAFSGPPVITYLNIGDYVESQGLQTSGGALNSSVNTDANCALTAVWVHG